MHSFESERGKLKERSAKASASMVLRKFKAGDSVIIVRKGKWKTIEAEVEGPISEVTNIKNVNNLFDSMWGQQYLRVFYPDGFAKCESFTLDQNERANKRQIFLDLNLISSINDIYSCFYDHPKGGRERLFLHQSWIVLRPRLSAIVTPPPSPAHGVQGASISLQQAENVAANSTVSASCRSPDRTP